MARPSIVRERRKQILDAFEDCILEHGIRGATFNRIGEILALDGSTLHHYYHTRADLLDALFERMKGGYLRRIEDAVSRVPGENRANALVEHLFSTSFHQPKNSRLIMELERELGRDRDTRRQIKRLYRELGDHLLATLEKEFPDSSAERRRTVAYALASLTEGATVFTSLGFGSERRRAARLIAFEILETLRPSGR